jgi:hypothetical protein
MSLTAGQSLGPYTILVPLGADGMGEVYRARDARLNRDVEIKVIPRSVTDSPEALSRFERESHAIAALSHPNILTIFDVGHINGHPYAVMELLVKISATNRGPDAADLHLLPTLWFRNDWSPWIAASNRAAEKPHLEQSEGPAGTSTVAASHPLLGSLVLSCDGDVPLLFTENETNHERLFPGQRNESPHVKDGSNDFVVNGRQHAVNPAKQGTKVAAHYQVHVGAGKTAVMRLRLSSSVREQKRQPFGKAFDTLLDERRREADEFYQAVTPPSLSPDAANVMRQAIAGMLWSKQFFFFDGDNRLDEQWQTGPAGQRVSRANPEWRREFPGDAAGPPRGGHRSRSLDPRVVCKLFDSLLTEYAYSGGARA